jgi:antitoxin component of MazEF toxin-antitoxin module
MPFSRFTGEWGEDMADARRARIFWRGTAVETIPPALLKLMDADISTQLSLSVNAGELITRPVKSGRNRYSLTELLEGSHAMRSQTPRRRGRARAIPSAARFPDGPRHGPATRRHLLDRSQPGRGAAK